MSKQALLCNFYHTDNCFVLAICTYSLCDFIQTPFQHICFIFCNTGDRKYGLQLLTASNSTELHLQIFIPHNTMIYAEVTKLEDASGLSISMTQGVDAAKIPLTKLTLDTNS
jgi:hypothetical protein